MTKKTFQYFAFFLGVLFLLSDTLGAVGKAVLNSGAATGVQEMLGTALDETGELSCWFSKLAEREDPL